MNSSRGGFTLVELLIAIVMMTLVGGVVFALLNSTQRVSTAQAERMMMQSSVRTGALVIPAELREIATSTAGQTDLMQIAADSVTYRAARGLGFTCGTITATQIKILNTSILPFSGLRAIAPGRDSLLLFVDGNPDSRTDDIWVRLPITSTATSTCGTQPAIAVNTPSFLALLPGGLLSTVIVGGPVRTEEVMRLKSYASGGQQWVGVASLSGGDAVQPILGPITAGGFSLTYLDGSGAVTAIRDSVRMIQLRLIGVTERRVARGGTTGANVILQDTLVTRVMLRNTPR